MMKLKHFIADKDSARFKQWAYITYLCTAIRYLRDAGLSKDAKTMAQEVLGYQMENGSWSKHTFVTSLVLYTLQDFGLQNSATEKAKAYLRQIQNPDGGFPPFKLPVWDTAFTLASLDGAGNLGSITYDAKRFLLENVYDGGWGWDTGVEPEYDSTSMAVHALDGMSGLPSVKPAIEYLIQNQKEDGSWGTWRKHEPGSPDVTAHCILALPEPYHHQRTRAADYLLNSIEGGTWLPHWFFDLNYGASQCALAIKSVYDDDIKLGEVQDFIEKARNKDGGWGSIPGAKSNPMSTAHAVLALTILGTPKVAEDGVEWLVSHQTDGSWGSVACGIGPRPIRYSDYAIVHASCVWALSQWQDKAHKTSI